MISPRYDLPDDPVLLKQLLLETLSRQEESTQAYQIHIVDLKEQIKRLRDRPFGCKSDQTNEPNKHELTCGCGCRKHAIGEETSEQLDIVPI